MSINPGQPSHYPDGEKGSSDSSVCVCWGGARDSIIDYSWLAGRDAGPESLWTVSSKWILAAFSGLQSPSRQSCLLGSVNWLTAPLESAAPKEAFAS